MACHWHHANSLRLKRSMSCVAVNDELSESGIHHLDLLDQVIVQACSAVLCTSSRFSGELTMPLVRPRANTLCNQLIFSCTCEVNLTINPHYAIDKIHVLKGVVPQVEYLIETAALRRRYYFKIIEVGCGLESLLHTIPTLCVFVP